MTDELITIDCHKCGYRIGLFGQEEIIPGNKEPQFECPKCLCRVDVIKEVKYVDR